MQKLFKSDNGNIIVSYPELHNIVSSSNMAIVKTTRYEEGTEPGFWNSESSFRDVQGNLYYLMPTNYSGTSYPNIPAVYNFQTNTAILYYFENFLSDEEKLVEFIISITTMVSYDAKTTFF